MKFLAVLVLLGVSTFLVSAQTATTPTQEETGPANVTTTAAATTAATTAAATTTTTTAATTTTTTAATTAPKRFPGLPKWLQDILSGKLLP
ncbi:mucin-like protein 1 [Saimiri boliviensis]|uniref:mucin-like protein 1 n=1 Tax=Saimiri boliviensis TaxID=27679 RepID=UPI000533C15B